MIVIATELKDLSLRELVPPNLLTDTNINALIQALDPQLKAITDTIPNTAILSHIDALPEGLIDVLAWQFHVDFYDLAENLHMKRNMVKNSILLHMKKGTVWAIKEALRQIDVTADFVPWYEMEEPGEPYTFALHTIISGDFYRTAGRDVLMKNIRRAVEEAKSPRSTLTYLSTAIKDTQEQELYAGIFPYLYGDIVIHPKPPEVQAQGYIYTATASSLSGQIYLGLQHEYEQQGQIFTAMVASRSINIEIGVDLDLLQELLLRFEDRVFTRMDNDAKATNARLDKLENMLLEIMKEVAAMNTQLTWSGDYGRS